MGLPLRIELMAPEDLPAHGELLTSGFAETLQHLVGVPPMRPEGERMRHRFERPDTRILVIRDEDGVQGLVHLQRTGSRSVGGPLALSPSHQPPYKQGVARELIARLVREADAWGCPAIDSVTFPQSLVHFRLYWSFGIPVYVAPFLSKKPGRGRRAPAARGISVERFGDLSPDRAEQAMERAFQITDAVYPGLDHRADIRHCRNVASGEVLLARDGERIEGFAICHFREGGEQFFMGQLLIKYLYVDPRAARATDVLAALLDGCDALASEAGVRDLGAMASTGRRAVLDRMLEHGWHVSQLHSQFLFVAGADPVRTQEVASASFRPEHYVLAEWR